MISLADISVRYIELNVFSIGDCFAGGNRSFTCVSFSCVPQARETTRIRQCSDVR